jgi:hypothetical protein
MKFASVLLGACLIAGAVGSGSAQDLRVMGSAVGMAIPGTTNATLRVSGPNGFYMQTFSRSGSVALQLGAAGRLPDGLYHYEVTAATAQRIPNPNRLMSSGRANEPAMVNVGTSRFGTFNVKNGAIVLPRPASENARR